MENKVIALAARNLASWYQQNHRDLPWRKNRDPYRIWISEIMLQQTTVQAVIPYYEKFMTLFPDVDVLAGSPQPRVLEAWSGLGYYSRARNLHKAAQILAQTGFAKTADQLLPLPGFGPYTSRAVASLAFGDSVGVLDGNVIRILSRLIGLPVRWWESAGRQSLQKLADAMVQDQASDVINQGMMELGAMICTPQKPLCMLCPWTQICQANKQGQTATLPLKKPRRQSELWLWEPRVFLRQGAIQLVKNDYAPFLRGQWILPGTATQIQQKPKDYSATHGITHHQIFIRPLPLQKARSTAEKTDLLWVKIDELRQVAPSALLQKVLHEVIPHEI